MENIEMSLTGELATIMEFNFFLEKRNMKKAASGPVHRKPPSNKIKRVTRLSSLEVISLPTSSFLAW